MPSLFGSPPPPPSYRHLVTGDSSEFTSTVGNWTNTGGTQSRDTALYWPNSPLVASLKLVTTAAGHRTDLAIPGSFVAGAEYAAFIAVSLEESTGLASLRTAFGLVGTDAQDVYAGGFNLTTAPKAWAGGNFGVVGLRWKPTATRTGVTLRVERPDADGGNTQTWHIGWVKVFRLPVVDGPAFCMSPGDGVGRSMFIAPTSFAGVINYAPSTHLNGGVYSSIHGYGGLDTALAGYDFGSWGLYLWGEGSPGSEGDLAGEHYILNVGPDYVGLDVSEKDSDTVQIYADAVAGYMMQLRNRGSGKGWALSDDGTLNQKITDTFQWPFYVAGAQTTGTDKAAYFQVPAKCMIDEVRIHLGTAPIGLPVIVDVNDDGTTIFTTQANRPMSGVGAKNLTSGGDSTDGNFYVTASVTMKAGRLYLMSVENSHASAAAAPDGVEPLTGGAFSMVSRSTTTFNGGLNRTSIWSCVPSQDYTGGVNISFSPAQTGATWSLDEVTGVDTTSNDGIVQQAVGSGTSTTPLVTLAAFAAAANGTYAAHGHAAATATTPGTGWTELSDATTATPAQAIETAYRFDNDTTADATIASEAWGSCAIELSATPNDATSREVDGGIAVAKDSVLTVDVDQIGSGTAGSDLVVFVRGRLIW